MAAAVLSDLAEPDPRRATAAHGALASLELLRRHGLEEEYDPIAEAPAPRGDNPLEQRDGGRPMQALEQALAELPVRQREAFTLRNFEGLDVAQTAVAMGCTEGSVKTHYSRAVHRLREMLADMARSIGHE